MSIAAALQPERPPADAVSFAVRLSAGAQTMHDIEGYRSRLETANAQINLVGPSAMAEFWPRHAFDSAQLRLHAPYAQSFIDIGAGAGFPGIILAILLKPSGGHVHLVESIAKRCAFLRDVVDALALPATVHHARAESVGRLRAQIVTARACAPIDRLFDLALPFMQDGARGLFLKGRGVEAEIAEARPRWSFTGELIPSLSDPDGRLVSVTELRRA